MTKSDLRTLYNRDMLVEAVVEHSLLTEGWIVEFRHSRGGLVPLTDSNGTERCFGNLDAASENALDVGFNQVRIIDD